MKPLKTFCLSLIAVMALEANAGSPTYINLNCQPYSPYLAANTYTQCDKTVDFYNHTPDTIHIDLVENNRFLGRIGLRGETSGHLGWNSGNNPKAQPKFDDHVKPWADLGRSRGQCWNGDNAGANGGLQIGIWAAYYTCEQQ